MADSRYCRLCKGPCEGRSICLQTPDRFKPSSDMIKTALEKKRAFTSPEFCTISSNPPAPEIWVTDGENGVANVAVRLTSIPFIPQYRDPKSPEVKKLEKAAREEIIRSFDLPRGRVRDGDIEVEIKEGSVRFFIKLVEKIVYIIHLYRDYTGGNSEIPAPDITNTVGSATGWTISFGTAAGVGLVERL